MVRLVVEELSGNKGMQKCVCKYTSCEQKKGREQVLKREGGRSVKPGGMKATTPQYEKENGKLVLLEGRVDHAT